MITSRYSIFVLRYFIIGSLALSTAFVAAAADLEARLQPSRSQSGKADYDNLQVVFIEKDAPEQRLLVTDAVTTASSYELLAKKGDQTTPVEIASVRAVPKGAATALRLEIIPKEHLDPDTFDSLQLRPKDASLWRFKDGSSYHFAGNGSFAVIKSEILIENRNYYRRFSGLQNHVDTGHNLKGGVLSLDLHYEARSSEESTKSGAFVFFANAKGDFVLPTKEKKSFFNSVNADGEYVYTHLPNVWTSSAPGASFDPHNIAPPENQWEPYWDLGISGKYESDQSFDNENLLAGVVAHVIARNPITAQIQRAILLNGPLFLNPKRIMDVALAPLFTFRYDYVDHAKQDGTVVAGNNRFTGSLFYRLPLARQIDILKATALTKQVFDSDFIAEVEVLYDVDKKKVTDNSKLTLDIRPHTDSEHQPSFTFTYAQGKATPTFKHFDAFVAGLKIPF